MLLTSTIVWFGYFQTEKEIHDLGTVEAENAIKAISTFKLRFPDHKLGAFWVSKDAVFQSTIEKRKTFLETKTQGFNKHIYLEPKQSSLTSYDPDLDNMNAPIAEQLT